MVNMLYGTARFFAVPSVPRLPWGIAGLVLNIVPVAGLGSVLIGIKAKHYGTLSVGVAHVAADLGAVALVYTSAVSWPAPLIFAVWGWSILWGIRIFRASFRAAAGAVAEAR